MVSSQIAYEQLRNIQQQMTKWILPIWLIFGTIGCCLNLLVLSRPQLRKNSCCIYFFAASIDHLFTLFIGIVPNLYSLNHPDPRLEYLWFCKLRGYLFQISLMLSRWFVSFASIDRYIASSENTRYRNLANKRTALRAIAATTVFWSIVCTHRLIFFDIKGFLCSVVYNVPAAIYHSFYVVVGGGLAPMSIMTICAFLIRKNLHLKQQRRNQLTSIEVQRKVIDQQVNRLLLIQIIFYIIFTTPQLLSVSLNAATLLFDQPSVELLSVSEFLVFFAELMLFLFPVSSFYLYTLTARTFRMELIKFVRHRIMGQNQINPVVISSN